MKVNRHDKAAALTDEHALNVTYRYDRGEPRGPKRKSESWDGRGDCVDCNQCVQVCPVGIDIRNGSQLECIHCALCIDACDEMMRRVERPIGLIAYDTDVAVAARAAGTAVPKYRMIRTRTVLYAVLMAVIGCLMLYGLMTKATFEMNVLKDRSPPFVRMSNGDIQNGYTLKLVNKDTDVRRMRISLEDADGAQMKIIGLDTQPTSQFEVPVAAYGVDRYRVLVVASKGESLRNVTFKVTDIETGETDSNRVAFRSGN